MAAMSQVEVRSLTAQYFPKSSGKGSRAVYDQPKAGARPAREYQTEYNEKVVDHDDEHHRFSRRSREPSSSYTSSTSTSNRAAPRSRQPSNLASSREPQSVTASRSARPDVPTQPSIRNASLATPAPASSTLLDILVSPSQGALWAQRTHTRPLSQRALSHAVQALQPYLVHLENVLAEQHGWSHLQKHDPWLFAAALPAGDRRPMLCIPADLYTPATDAAAAQRLWKWTSAEWRRELAARAGSEPPVRELLRLLQCLLWGRVEVALVRRDRAGRCLVGEVLPEEAWLLGRQAELVPALGANFYAALCRAAREGRNHRLVPPPGEVEKVAEEECHGSGCGGWLAALFGGSKRRR
jgi:hypothetical protein